MASTRLKSGHTAEPLSDEDSKRISKDFPGLIDGVVRVQPGGWFVPAPFVEVADKLYDFKFRASDVVIMTHPKCGTTWTQDLVWNMIHNPNIDDPAAKECINIRCPHLELDVAIMGKLKEESLSDSSNPVMQQFAKFCPDANPADGPGIQAIAATPGVRIIKTHLTFPLLSPNLLDTAKVIYVSRNPKDMCVSFHHQCRVLKLLDYQGDMDRFVDYMINGELPYGPYWNHVKEGWKHREHPNLLFLFFEDLKADTMAEVKKLNRFLGTDLTEEQLEKVTDYTSFDKMKARDGFYAFSDEMKVKIQNQEVVQKEGDFFWKGKVGNFKGKLTPEQEAKIDAWTRKNMEGMDIAFKYDI